MQFTWSLALLLTLFSTAAAAPTDDVDRTLRSRRPEALVLPTGDMREVESWAIDVDRAGRHEVDVLVWVNRFAGDVTFRVEAAGGVVEAVVPKSSVDLPVWVPLGSFDLPAGRIDVTLLSKTDFVDERSVVLVQGLRLRGGWRALFNGRDLTGWTLIGGHGSGYVVQDGMIVCPADSGGNLLTEDTYDDFALRFEFRLTGGANNGLGIRTPPRGDAAYVGMELQILDNDAERFRNLRPVQYHGSIYDVRAALRGHLRPTGTWNVQEVLCEGRRVRVRVNGVTIVDADLDAVRDPEVLARHPGLARASGHIGFLGHGTEVAFRDIRLRPLPPDRTWPFEGAPTGWTFAETNSDETPATWSRVSDESGALEVRTSNSGQTYNLAIADGTTFDDFELNVRVKGVSGEEDRGGGPLWRCADPDHYYLCRLNPLEGNFRVYVVKAGVRKQLASADVPIDSDRWYDVRVRMIGSRIRCALDGAVLLDVRDPTYRTGAVGVWSKADAVTRFDDLTVRTVEREP